MVQIITDSAADLPAAETAQGGVTVVPLTVTFSDGEALRDGIDITGDEFYARLAAEKQLPHTSQPSPAEFMRVFEDVRQAGDEAVVITLAASFSGTLQNAQIAAESCGADAWFVDSGTASQAEGLLVREALRLRDEGLSAAEIAARLDELKKRVRILAVVDGLKHLHKGGRLPAAVALVGGALGVRPVLLVRDGVIKLADTARGRPGAYVALFKNIEKQGGVDPAYGYTLLYSDEKQVLAPIHRYMHETLHLTGGRLGRLGAVIGTHTGSGCAALVFVAKEE